MEQYIAEAKENGARIDSKTGKESALAKDINWIYPDSLSHNMKFEQLTFRFRSFCPYMLAENGILVPGAADIGILCYDEGFYVFSSVKEKFITWVIWRLFLCNVWSNPLYISII